VLAPVALLALARLTEQPRSLFLTLAATGLLTGLAATVSRAGALAFTVGLIVLALLRGPRATARAGLGPVAGALLALACLLPSMPAAAAPWPMLAVAGLAAGLALAAVVRRLPRRAVMALALFGVLAGGLVMTAADGDVPGDALRTVAVARANIASPARADGLRAAARVVGEHPLSGVGPSQAHLQWTGRDGATRILRYAHNEYVQVAVEFGLPGLTLLAILLLAIARSLWIALWIARAAAPGQAASAGVLAAATAFAVHSGFDFVWHLPAVLLTVLVLIGTVLPARPRR
jgi:O-Antigen ligase